MKNRTTGRVASMLGNMTFVGIGLAVSFWLLDSIIIDVLLFNEGNFQQTFQPEAHEVYLRVLVGILFFMFGVYAQRSISRSKRADEALQQSREQNEALLSAIPDLMFLIDGDGTFLRYKAERDDDLAMPATEFMGKSIYDVMSAEVAQRTMGYVKQALQTEDTPRFEYKLRRLKGDMRNYEARFAACGEEQVLILVRDLTEQKRLEEELRQSQKMEAVGRLAAGVAHELNNPLGAIVGYSDIVLEQGRLDDMSKDLVTRILKRSDQAAKIVRQLKGFVQPSQFQKDEVDLSQVIEETIEMVARQVALQGVRIAVHLDPEIRSIWADHDGLEQVFLNIALNAKDAMPQGGELVITTRPSEGDRSVEITFTDTGVGIPGENLEKIFDPFFTSGKSRQETDPGPSATKQTVQGHVGHTRVGSRRGTGLGLSISQRIVQDHGGHINVKSVEGQGAAFTIVLPTGE